MKISRILFLTVVIVFSLSADKGWAREKLFSCRNPELGVRFSCSPTWEVVFNDTADFFVIAEEPEVVLTITKEPTKLISLSELTSNRLDNFGQYADGFQTEVFSLNGMSAVKVKAFDKNSSDIRLTDIYLIEKGYLYKIMFSVAPKAEWNAYQFLLNDILKEFSLIEETAASE